MPRKEDNAISSITWSGRIIYPSNTICHFSGTFFFFFFCSALCIVLKISLKFSLPRNILVSFLCTYCIKWSYKVRHNHYPLLLPSARNSTHNWSFSLPYLLLYIMFLKWCWLQGGMHLNLWLLGMLCLALYSTCAGF